MLPFYVQHFHTVELNASFYRLPKAATFDGWRQKTPPNFVFVGLVGKNVASSPLPAALHRMTGAEVIFGAGIPCPDGRYRLVLSDPIPTQECDSYEEFVTVNTSAYNAVFERFIRQYPTRGSGSTTASRTHSKAPASGTSASPSATADIIPQAMHSCCIRPSCRYHPDTRICPDPRTPSVRFFASAQSSFESVQESTP
ncbi:MAG TPA: DUF72 domain-containing protein [bacterium]|nr:DUF72 domain-containing protein [bacterium]